MVWEETIIFLPKEVRLQHCHLWFLLSKFGVLGPAAGIDCIHEHLVSRLPTPGGRGGCWLHNLASQQRPCLHALLTALLLALSTLAAPLLVIMLSY